MCYPVRILPKSEYIGNAFDGERLIAIDPLILVGRRLDAKPEDCLIFDEENNPMEIAYRELPKSKIWNLSLSLLGSIFRIEDFYYNQKEEGCKPWTDKQTKNIADFSEGRDFYKIDSPITVVAWTVNNIHIVSLTDKRNFSKLSAYTKWIEELEKRTENQEDLKKYIEAYLKVKEKAELQQNAKTPSSNQKINETVELEAYLRIRHNPTNLNYWHVTMDIYPEDYFGKIPPKEDTDDKFLQRLFNTASDILRKSFIVCDENLTIPPVGDCYTEKG